MKGISRFAASRVLAVAAILSTAAIVWFGWWMLAFSLAAAMAAAMLAPERKHHRGRGAVREAMESLGRRLHPHSWRPRG